MVGKGCNESKNNKKNNNKNEDANSCSKMTDSSQEVIPRCSSMDTRSNVHHGLPFSDTLLDESSLATSSFSVLTDTTEKSVRFDKECYVNKTISRHKYTPQEIEDCWFSDQEYRQIREECFEIIRSIERGKEPSSTDNCVRGLNCRTQTAAIAKQRNRLNALWIVLNEQCTESSPECIADEYSNISYRCELWARCVGREDQREAEACCWGKATE
mmetsp:Transcript_7977/g.17161  ORF Transcript_7977/g.17161 Transcript_7977/m.17161 type:complete len:214 (-) Transcript_7977:74-715(-)